MHLSAIMPRCHETMRPLGVHVLYRIQCSAGTRSLVTPAINWNFTYNQWKVSAAKALTRLMKLFTLYVGHCISNPENCMYMYRKLRPSEN